MYARMCVRMYLRTCMRRRVDVENDVIASACSMLALGNLGAANAFRDSFQARLPVAEPTPLDNFIRFLLLTLEVTRRCLDSATFLHRADLYVSPLTDTCVCSEKRYHCSKLCVRRTSPALIEIRRLRR